MTARVGFVGLGRMGRPMAINVQKKQFPVKGYDTNPHGMEALEEAGGTRAASTAEAVADADVVFTMLPNSPDVKEVVLNEIIPNAKAGTIIVDMSTIDPLVTDEVAAAAKAAGMHFADAPVGRLATHADRGESLFMVGADPEVFEKITPMLEAMGTTIHHCGGPGSGIRMKIVNNYQAIASCQLNAETLTLATKLGLDLSQTLEVLNGTTATNGHLKTNYPLKVLSDDITPGFQIDLAQKDLGLALSAASAMSMSLAMGATARECLQLARSAGFGGNDFSALLDHWCKASAVEAPRLPEDERP